MLAQRLVGIECFGCKQRSSGAAKGQPCNPKKCIPREVREQFYRAENFDTPEAVLWRDIAARVVLDACGFVESAEERDEAVREAQRWFFSKDPADRDEVFSLAGLDGAIITESIRKHISR